MDTAKTVIVFFGVVIECTGKNFFDEKCWVDKRKIICYNSTAMDQ